MEQLGPEVSVRSVSVEPSLDALAAVSAVRRDATLCLTSALVHHGLRDLAPVDVDIALPRGARRPTGIDGVAWHSFDPGTFGIGREVAELPGGPVVAIYSAERTIVDSFRLRHQGSGGVAQEALRRWVACRGNSPAKLLAVAASFPKAEPSIRQALAVLR